jgi:hypothetical protein
VRNLRRFCGANVFLSCKWRSSRRLLIDFDLDRAQAKIVPTGQILVIGTTPDGPLYLKGFVIDPNFPAFANCANLQL